jgi:hypothetical protein
MKTQTKDYKDLTDTEIQQIKDREKIDHIKWLYFIIADKKQMAVALINKKNAHRILMREAEHYQKELNLLIGFTPEPSEFDDLSSEMKALKDKLINKQNALIACKSNKEYVQKLESELRIIEIEIEKQERLEGKSKELEETPF